MNQTQIDVQKAIQSALHHLPFDHEIHDPKAFYIMVMENGLSGLIFPICKEEKTHPELYHRLKRNHYDYIARDVKQLKAISDITTLLQEEGIDHLFLKGSVLKHIYPETYMRAMGDIDILIKEHELSHIHEVFKEKNITCTSRSAQHDVFELPNGIVIEVHPTLYRNFNEDYQFIKDVWQYAKEDKPHLYHLNHAFEIVYLLYHLAKHIAVAGIGLRSVLDISLYLKTYENNIDLDELNHMLGDMKLHQFFEVIIDLSHRYFGFSYQHFVHKNILSDKNYDMFIDYLTTSGIHGIGRDNNIMMARATTYAKKNQSKMKLMFDIIFPKFETMVGIYPWLKRFVILYPLTWVFRWIHILITRPIASIKKIKQMRISNEKIEEQKEFMSSIGL
jgi:hypothetical protein